MQGTISLEEAQAHLAEIIAALSPGEELFITQDERLIAKLVAQEAVVRFPQKPGTAVGKLIIHADDDEHLIDFEVYMHEATSRHTCFLWFILNDQQLSFRAQAMAEQIPVVSGDEAIDSYSVTCVW